MIDNIGQPVAWAISDKEDCDTLQAVWSAVHKRSPSAIVSNITTDVGTVYSIIQYKC